MHSGMTMEELISEVARREESKKDYIVGPQSMMMQDDKYLLIHNQKEKLNINDVAHQQLATKLGIPKRYYDDVAKVPGLRTYNVNALLGADKAKHLVRTMDGTARAFLSDRFQPMAYDYFNILESVLPVLAEQKNLQVRSAQISDKRLYLQVVFPKIQGEVRVGETVQAGLTITDSEVGYGSVSVESFIFILRCSNGMVGESLLRKYHTGRRLNEDDDEEYDIYSDETIKANMKAFQLRLRDIVKASINESRFKGRLDLIKKAAGMEIPQDDTEKIVENVTKRFVMTEAEGKNMLKNLWKGNDFTRWGVSNAVTAIVHEAKDIDRQYELEKIGNEIVAMPDRNWEALLKANV